MVLRGGKVVVLDKDLEVGPEVGGPRSQPSMELLSGCFGEHRESQSEITFSVIQQIFPGVAA